MRHKNWLLVFVLLSASSLPLSGQGEIFPSDNTRCSVLSELDGAVYSPDLYRFIQFVGFEVVAMDHYYVTIGQQPIILTNLISFVVHVTGQVTIQCKNRPDDQIKAVIDVVYIRIRNQLLQ